MKSALVLAAAGMGVGVVSQGGLVVTTLNGTLQGAKCASTDVNAFLSIPYAKAPVGDFRFASPQPWTEAFNGVRDATKPASSCIQFGTQFSEKSGQSEDW